MSHPPSAPTASDRAASSTTVAMLLEVCFGLFGMLGIGWLYAGRIEIALLAYIGFIILVAVQISLALATVGVMGCLILPLNAIIPIISGFRVWNSVRSEGARGPARRVVGGAILAVVVLYGGLAWLWFYAARNVSFGP